MRANCAVVMLAALGVGSVLAQVDERAAFVAHNWTLGGSISSFTFDANGQPVLVDNLPLNATSADNIAISPNGRYLACGHATSQTGTEPFSVAEVAADGTLTLLGTFQVDETPLDTVWVTDSLVATVKTNLSGNNAVILWRFENDPDLGASLTEVDREPTGNFSAYLALHPSGQWLYVSDTSPNTIYAFEVDAANEDLVPIQTVGSGVYPLDMAITADGGLLYAAGGISGGGHAISGYSILPDGTLAGLSGSPYTSPGSSPAELVVSGQFPLLFAGHGSDATVWSFDFDDETGVLTSTGNTFDVGLQGTIGGMAVLDELLLVTDESTAIDGIRGLYSFTINSDGSFVQNGPIVDTGSVVPGAIAVWSPPATGCAGDLTGDSVVDFDDFAALSSCWGQACGDLTGDGLTDFDDFAALSADWNCGR